MHEIPASDDSSAGGEIARRDQRIAELERGLHSVTRVIEALVGPLPAEPADELAARRRIAGAGQRRHVPG